MSFANPAAFLLFIALGLLIAWREKKGFIFRARLPYPSITRIKLLPGTWRTRSLKMPAWFIYVGLACMILALGRPRTVMKAEESHARGIDIMIALDTSGSMRALDFNPKNRMMVAREATKRFISRRQFDRIGLVAFAGVALLECPMTLDYAALLDFLDQIDVAITGTENTAIGTAIATAANHLKRSSAKSRVIVLVTDGRNNSGEIDPMTAAKAAASLGIRIYTIGVGIHGQSVIPVDTAWGKQLVPIEEDLDEPSLDLIARATGGRYYRAASTKDFDEIYKEIDSLEKTEIKGPTIHEYKDHYLGWLLLAMILLSAGYALEMTVLRTSP